MRHTLLARMLTGCALAVLLCVSSAFAVTLRPGDELLYVDVRPACCSTDPLRLEEQARVRQYTVDEAGCGRWTDADLSLWRAGSNGLRTLVWVDGNNLEPADAYRRGMQLYWLLARCSSDSDGPIRFVIFSWPSEKIGPMLRDFREKARRTRPVGWQLAWLINELPASEPVSLLGYSYGARISGGALHVLAGGELSGGLRLEARVPRPAIPVVLVAAATHAHWFAPDQYHGLAMQQADQVLLVLNRHDPAMQFYHLVDQNSDARALGLAGPACLSPGYASRFHCLDVTYTTGKSHDLYRYLSRQSTIQAVWHHLLSANSSSLPAVADSNAMPGDLPLAMAAQ